MFRNLLLKLIFAVIIIILSVTYIQAQNGIGDPLINVTFGAGANAHGPEFPGINRNYFFTVADNPPYGNYTILNNTNVSPGIWHPTLDHTPNDGNNGYMMIVKTRNQVGYDVLFEYPVNGLCAGTEYQVGAYIANISRNPGISPVIRLRVETNTTPRTLVRPDEVYTINNDPSGAVWRYASMLFTATPSTGSVVISIISETPGGPLTDDLALDDITVNARGQLIKAMFTGPAGDSAARITCADTPESFQVSVTPPDPGNAVKWQRKFNNGLWEDIPGAINSTYTITSSTTPGVYSYRAATAPPEKLQFFSCSATSNEITIRVRPLVAVSAGPRKFYLRGGTPVILEGYSNSTDIKWEAVSGADVGSLSSTTTAQPLASPNETTVYRLTAKPDNVNTCGPQVFAEVTVLVADDVDLPNTFTPNADGINDRWVIGGINSYPNPIVRVYNRNGQLIYRSAGTITPWDGTYNGKGVPAGSYYYIVDLGINGLKLAGSVAVLR